MLLWPALSLWLVTLAYARVGPAVFQKRHGRLGPAARVLLAPYLLGLWVTRLYCWRRDAAGPVEVCPGVWVGGLPRGGRLAAVLGRGGLIIDLTAEHNTPRAIREHGWVSLPVLDLLPPDAATVDQAVALVAAARAAGQAVYIYCALGYGRSVHLTAAYLCHAGHTPAVDPAAIRRLRMQPGAAKGNP